MIALAFSGGKDSLACLHLNKDRLHEITVLWVNTGNNYPDTLETINQVKSMCTSFIEIKSARDAQNDVYGLPSDIIPFENTKFGQNVTGKTETLIQPYFACCYDNITKPLMDKCKELGVTELISGKRDDEHHKSSDGGMVDGILHTHPIHDWTSEQVLEYLSFYMELPKHFNFSHSSLDCYDCSAYLKDTQDIFEWSKQYPDLHDKKVIRINQVKNVLTKAMEIYQ
jgi:phosphoadenosine phosphosulfate reductase